MRRSRVRSSPGELFFLLFVFSFFMMYIFFSLGQREWENVTTHTHNNNYEILILKVNVDLWTVGMPRGTFGACALLILCIHDHHQGHSRVVTALYVRTVPSLSLPILAGKGCVILSCTFDVCLIIQRYLCWKLHVARNTISSDQLAIYLEP